MLITSLNFKPCITPMFGKKQPSTKNQPEKVYSYLPKNRDYDFDDDYDDTFEYGKMHYIKKDNPDYKSVSGNYSVVRLTGSLAEVKEKFIGKNFNEILKITGIEYIPLKNIRPHRMQRINDTVDLSNNAKAINEFCTISTDFRYSNLRIDEEDIIDGVEIVLGDFNLRNTDLRSTKNIKYIGGELVIGKESAIEDLSSIQKIEKSILVEAETREEAIRMLKSKNLNMKILTNANPIILLPLSHSEGGRRHKTKNSVV